MRIHMKKCPNCRSWSSDPLHDTNCKYRVEKQSLFSRFKLVLWKIKMWYRVRDTSY